MPTLSLKSPASELRASDEVQFFPAVARLDSTGENWLVHVGGIVFEPGPDNLRRKLMLRLFRRVLKAEHHELTTDFFHQRVRGFLVITQRGRNIAVRIGESTKYLPRRTKRNGHFNGVVRIPVHEARAFSLSKCESNSKLSFNLAAPTSSTRSVQGTAHLIEPNGVSVISDIDDTIRLSRVANKRALLKNTFLRPFEAIDGMAPLYQSWAEQGCSFHYVSSSPWQLLESLREFCGEVGFPDGTFHLRTIRLRDPSVMKLFIARRRGKKTAIRWLLQAFPNRRFILIGDSVEKDAEIYGAMARRFPHQVHHIYIRQVEERPLRYERRDRAFRGLSPDKWTCFTSPRQIPPVLDLGLQAKVSLTNELSHYGG